MSDLISRQAAIDALCELCGDRGKCNCDICHDVEVFRLLPSAQPKYQWIPCEKELPKPNVPVLVSVNIEHSSHCCMAYYTQGYDYPKSGRVWIGCDGSGYAPLRKNLLPEPTHWMPLPEPYRDKQIDKQTAIDTLDRVWDKCEEIEAHLPDGDPNRTGYRMFPDYSLVKQYLLQSQEVIRCRDCKYNQNSPDAEQAVCTISIGMNNQDGFCHKAERRNGNDSSL